MWGKGGGPGPSGRGGRELLTLFRGLVKGATNPQSPSVGPGREKGQERLCHDQRNPGPSYSTRACWKFYRSTYEVCNLKQNNLKPSVCPSPPPPSSPAPGSGLGLPGTGLGFHSRSRKLSPVITQSASGLSPAPRQGSPRAGTRACTCVCVQRSRPATWSEIVWLMLETGRARNGLMPWCPVRELGPQGSRHPRMPQLSLGGSQKTRQGQVTAWSAGSLLLVGGAVSHGAAWKALGLEEAGEQGSRCRPMTMPVAPGPAGGSPASPPTLIPALGHQSGTSRSREPRRAARGGHQWKVTCIRPCARHEHRCPSHRREG